MIARLGSREGRGPRDKRGESVKRRLALPGALLVLAGLLVLWTSAAAGAPGDIVHPRAPAGPAISGAYEYGEQFAGTRITECPQAGMAVEPRELRQRVIDRVEQISDDGDDRRTNLEYSCFPQNETSVAINPRNTRNLLTTQNDYRTLSRQGFGASVDGGKTWYDEELPPLSVPNGDILDASGDPVSVYDRAGVAYSSSINFNRTDDENGITVQRSTNGGFTWTRPCVPIPGPAPADPDTGARCGSVGDPRQPGDGVVTYFDDPDNILDGSEPFDDKEWLAAGPRPAGVGPQCFTPVTRAPRECDPDVIGVDRLYVTWTRFSALPPFTAEIMLSYSDDEGRSWSPARSISGSAPFCAFGVGTNCDVNQFSVPTVHPKTGLLGVAFENFNTPHENQYLFVRSMDGGQTFQGPFFVTPVFDVNYPNAGSDRPDCTARGQQNGRQVLTNSCFRVNSGGNVVVDKRGDSMTSGFGDDFYLTMSDNRNGTNGSSNTDVFFFKSTDGGMTWIGPTRVNTDRSELTASRDSTTVGNFGNDQWFPWMDVSNTGVLAGGFHDRRLDTDSTRSEWPGSRQRAGNYLAWFFGAGCRITRTETVTAATTTIPTGARECLAPGAAVTPQPTAPVDPGADPVPGQGAAYLGPWRNQVVSDVPHNLDYSFRAGIFMGDYNAVAFPNVPPSGRGGDDHGSDQAVGFWTDSRNGRGSGNPTNPDTNQPGRNPACEQADVWLDYFDPLVHRTTGGGSQYDSLFLVTPCPQGAVDDRDGNEDGDDD
jgi:hypothetical protein